LPDID